MKIDYDVGDVVICIDDARRPSDSGSYWPIRIGSIHRITAIEDYLVHGLGVNLDCDPPEIAAEYAWHADRFKKLPKADDQFTAMIRKARQKEDA